MNPLLASIIEQLAELKKAQQKHKRDNPGADFREIRVDYMDADFFQGRKKRPIGSMDVIEAMAALADDVYIFEDFDLRDANRVVLRCQ